MKKGQMKKKNWQKIMNKSAININLRREKLTARNALTREEVENFSRKICEHLAANETVQKAKCVLTYLPYGKEVSLLPLNQFFWQRGVRLLAPVCSQTEPGIMQAAALTPAAMENLCQSSLGVLEPQTTAFADPANIDLVLVPGVVFDNSGNRMGHGKGYYDRYLPRLRADAYTIGIAYELQLTAKIPAEPWDYPLNALCTENGLRHF